MYLACMTSISLGQNSGEKTELYFCVSFLLQLLSLSEDFSDFRNPRSN